MTLSRPFGGLDYSYEEKGEEKCDFHDDSVTLLRSPVVDEFVPCGPIEVSQSLSAGTVGPITILRMELGPVLPIQS